MVMKARKSKINRPTFVEGHSCCIIHGKRAKKGCGRFLSFYKEPTSVIRALIHL
jgi:hypothetical protein